MRRGHSEKSDRHASEDDPHEDSRKWQATPHGQGQNSHGECGHPVVMQSAAVTVIYDDREPPPVEIKSMIGAARFSDILHRRATIGESIRRDIRQGGASALIHLLDQRDARELIGLIERSSADRIFFWLPSYFMPTVSGAFAQLVAKCSSALEACWRPSPEKGSLPRS